MDTEDRIFKAIFALLGVIVVACVVGVVYCVISSHRLHEECADKHGKVLKENCKTYYIRSGDLLIPDEECDERCLLPTAESAQ